MEAEGAGDDPARAADAAAALVTLGAESTPALTGGTGASLRAGFTPPARSESKWWRRTRLKPLAASWVASASAISWEG